MKGFDFNSFLPGKKKPGASESDNSLVSGGDSLMADAPAPTPAPRVGSGQIKRRLKQLFIVIVVLGVTAGGLAAVPFWFGLQAESAYAAFIAEIEKGGNLSVSNNRFERGWLESTADTTFAVVGTPITVSVLHRIEHGPIPLGDEISFEPVMARVKSQVSIGLGANMPKLAPLTANTLVQIDGYLSTRLEMPGSKSGADGSNHEWGGVNGTLDMSADFAKTRGEINAPLLSIAGKDGSFRLNGMKFAFDQQKSASGFDTGTTTLSVAKLSADGAGGKTTVDGFGITGNVQEAGGNLNVTLSVQIREAESAGGKQGPGQISVQIRKLDVATLAKFRNEAQGLRKQKLDAEQRNMMVLGKTLELLGQLAKKSPELEITKLSFKTADGEVTGKAKFVLDGSQLDVTGNPMLMLRALSGEGEISLPDSLVRLLAEPDVKRDIEALKKSGKLKKTELAKLTPKRIENITQQALKDIPQYRDSVIARLKLIPDGPNFKIVGTLKNGQVLVNNEPFQMPSTASPAPEPAAEPAQTPARKKK